MDSNDFFVIVDTLPADESVWKVPCTCQTTSFTTDETTRATQNRQLGDWHFLVRLIRITFWDIRVTSNPMASIDLRNYVLEGAQKSDPHMRFKFGAPVSSVVVVGLDVKVRHMDCVLFEI